MRGGLNGKRGSRLRLSATDKTVEWPERGVTRLAKVGTCLAKLRMTTANPETDARLSSVWGT
jgi:hypothetical protein